MLVYVLLVVECRFIECQQSQARAGSRETACASLLCKALVRRALVGTNRIEVSIEDRRSELLISYCAYSVLCVTELLG